MDEIVKEGPERSCYFCHAPIPDNAQAVEAKSKNAWAHFECWYDGAPFIRRTIMYSLFRGPKTEDQLVEDVGLDISTIRSALQGIMYKQMEVDHPEHGKKTAWVWDPHAPVQVDGKGLYSLSPPEMG